MLDNNTQLDYVTLRVKDLNGMVKFYTQIIGLVIREQSDHRVMLGSDVDIVELIYNEDYVVATEKYQGLYHLAIRVPEEKYLGQLLFHFRDSNYSIDGAGDHGYSQALYMQDIEGNGIEIYADRPRSEWTIYDDGSIDAYTDAVNVQNLIKGVNPTDWKGIPNGTDLGHVHLQVSDVGQASKFYLGQLGFEMKTDMGHAIFISKRGYHHDLGINQWLGDLPVLPKMTTGLDKVRFTIKNLDALKSPKEIHDKLIKVDEHTYQLVDPASIVLEFSVEQ